MDKSISDSRIKGAEDVRGGNLAWPPRLPSRSSC